MVSTDNTIPLEQVRWSCVRFEKEQPDQREE